MTRIVAGTAGGRTLRVPPKGTRPTSERVREALFSALDATGALDDARVLDLYAGSGALGLEALSRGAREAVLVESERAAVGVLRSNVDTVGLPGARVRTEKVGTLLRSPPDAPFDVVFADPPYDLSAAELDDVLRALIHWTAPGAIVVVERSGRTSAPSWPPPLYATREKRYGETTLYWAQDERPVTETG